MLVCLGLWLACSSCQGALASGAERGTGNRGNAEPTMDDYYTLAAPKGARPKGVSAGRGRAPASSLDDITNGLTSESTEYALKKLTVLDRGGVPSEPPANDPADTPRPSDRLMVYKGRVDLDVARAADAIAKFVARAAELGGHLSVQTDTEVTVRVPAQHFDKLFAELRGYGRVLFESRQASDVTEQFTDLGIRLDNARKGRDRLLALLEKAEKVEDILKIEEQLRRLSEEVERLEGQKRLLADQIALATLTAQFHVIAPQAAGDRQREPSRFQWVNEVGAESLRRAF